MFFDDLFITTGAVLVVRCIIGEMGFSNKYKYNPAGDITSAVSQEFIQLPENSRYRYSNCWRAMECTELLIFPCVARH